jgi:hypothetical protein
VNVTAANTVDGFVFVGGVGGGIAGIAGGVDVGVVRNPTRATIGTGADVRAAQDIGVYALSNKDVTTIAISLSAGIAALAGTVSVWTVGTKVDSNYSSDSSTADSLNEGGGGSETGQSTDAADDKGDDFSTMLSNSSSGTGKNETGQRDALKGASTRTGATPRGGADAAIAAAAETGTKADVDGSMTAGGAITVRAQERIDFTIVVGTVSVGVVGIGAAVGVLNVHSATEAYIGNGTVSAGGNVTVDAS